MKRPRLVNVLTIVAAFCLVAGPARAWDDSTESGKHTRIKSLFKAKDYLKRVSYLASDRLEGRGTGQDGIEKAARYIAKEFKKYGVKPAGDEGTYFQEFSLSTKSRIGVSTRLSVRLGEKARRRRSKLNKGFVPLPMSKPKKFEGQVVFAGYGIERDAYNDYDDLDVAGKVVLLLRRTPDFGEFNMRDAGFSGKISRAAAHDAAAVLIVNRAGDDAGLYNFGNGSRRPGRGVPAMHITQKLANEMLAAADLPDLKTLQEKIEQSEEPASQALPGVEVKGKVSIRRVKMPCRNVVGVIPGKGPQKDEYIVVGGHYDHLGIRNKDKAGFDPTKDISNGADDNASGTVGVLTIAEAFAKGPKPNRSILLILFTAEEMGLLGSNHFSKNATVPLDKCVAMLNMDMIGRLKDNKLQVGGIRTGTGFEEMVMRFGERYDIEVSGGGVSGRSDHASFYRADIPVLFFFTGIHKQYHRPEDDTDLLNIEGAIRVAKLVADCVDEIDAMSVAPEFFKDDRAAPLMRHSEEAKKPAAKPAEERVAGRRPEPPVPQRRAAGERVRLGIVPAESDKPGLLVGEVSDDTPASRAGLKKGDRIVRIGKRKIESVEDAIAALGKFKRGDKATLRVKRGGKTISVKVVFGRPKRADAGEAAEPGEPADPHRVAVAAAHSPDLIAPMIDAVLSVCETAAKDSDHPGTVRIHRSADSIETTVVFGESAVMRGPAIRGEAVDSMKQAVGSMKQFAAKAPGGVSMSIDYDGSVVRVRVQRRSAAIALAGGEGGRFVLLEPKGKPGDKKAAGKAKQRKAQKKQQKKKKQKAKTKKETKVARRADPRGDMDADAESTPPMPMVKLGIMPSYGDPDGRGFEISGVVEGGPAERGGMKDDDRILKIGKYAVSDIYSYMEALGHFKPGKPIKVIVLRDGKEVTLTIKGDPSDREAA